MSISKADIEKIATLSRLKVSDTEATELTARLGDILAMVDTMQAVDTSGIEPTPGSRSSSWMTATPAMMCLA